MYLGIELNKFACKFPACSVHVPCKFRTSFVQMSCTKTCNASALHALTKEFVGFVPSAYALHVFVQRICIADFVQVFFTSSTN